MSITALYVPNIWESCNCSLPSGFTQTLGLLFRNCSCFHLLCVTSSKHQGRQARGVSNVVMLIVIARTPPPFLLLRHTSGWRSKRGVRATRVATQNDFCFFFKFVSIVTFVTWDFWNIIIFFYAVLLILFFSIMEI